jgi:hypothetical protein
MLLGRVLGGKSFEVAFCLVALSTPSTSSFELSVLIGTREFILYCCMIDVYAAKFLHLTIFLSALTTMLVYVYDRVVFHPKQ